MAIPRLQLDTTALLVIDVQERLIHTIHQHELLIARCKALVGAATILKMPIIVTEQYVKGLGRTVPQIAETFPPNTPVFEKQSFSALTPNVLDLLRSLGRPHLLICGIEAHVCVLQTVLDGCAQGIQTFHLTDAISSGQPDQIDPAFRRMERAGSVPSGVLSALYELMGSCDHPGFREVLPFAKIALQAR